MYCLHCRGKKLYKGKEADFWTETAFMAAFGCIPHTQLWKGTKGSQWMAMQLTKAITTEPSKPVLKQLLNLLVNNLDKKGCTPLTKPLPYGCFAGVAPSSQSYTKPLRKGAGARRWSIPLPQTHLSAAQCSHPSWLSLASCLPYSHLPSFCSLPSKMQLAQSTAGCHWCWQLF